MIQCFAFFSTSYTFTDEYSDISKKTNGDFKRLNPYPTAFPYWNAVG